MLTKFWLENLKRRDQLEDNIRMDLGEVERVVVDWIHLAQDRD
jgi:hypothetical protein